jgi:spermidine dehydrogenase
MGETAAGFADTKGSVDVHLPDGGASIARALVRALVPAALPGIGLDDLVTAPTDYHELDRPGAPVRIRLSATATRAANVAGGVRVEYQRAGRGYAVGARHAVLACWNAVIPHLCPELPAAQQAALHELIKTPLIYANVAVRSAAPLYRLGVSEIHAPGGYFSDLQLNECVAIGGYATPTDAASAALLRLGRTPCSPGLPEHQQNRIGRAQILGTSLGSFEQEIRGQLDRMLGPGGFDSARDVLAITVNRWPHGYAPEFNPLFDAPLPEAERPHVRGRARCGAIAIANSDAAAKAYMDAAIEQADRAVRELLDA